MNRLVTSIYSTSYTRLPSRQDLSVRNALATHALGALVDEMLQPLVKAQATYFRDSFALKRWLDSLIMPANSSIFTYDAVSMYTNIYTED